MTLLEQLVNNSGEPIVINKDVDDNFVVCIDKCAVYAKCDRCGIEITPKVKNCFEELSESFKNAFSKNRTDLMLVKRGETNLYVDLCPDCKASLVEWYMRGGKEE